MTVSPYRLLDPDCVSDPYPFYDALRATAPVWRAGDAPIYLVTGFAPLAEAAGRIGDFSSQLRALLYRSDDGLLAAAPIDVGPQTLAIADPPVHTLHKKLISPNFVSQRIMLIENDLASFAARCLERIDAMERFDLMAQLAGPLPMHALTLLIGFDRGNETALLQSAYAASEMIGGTMTLAQLHAAHVKSDGVRDWLASQLDARTGDDENDLLGALKRVVDAGGISRAEALVTLVTLLSAGAESTAALIANAVRILAENPDVLQALRDNPEAIGAFIEEAGRLESPFRHHLRSVPADTELDGVSIPAGSSVMLMWSAANRDPARFDQPNRIDLTRRAQHVTFGRGIHLCIGAALARLEARIAIGALVRHHRFPRLCPDEPPQWEYNLMVRRHRTLAMVW